MRQKLIKNIVETESAPKLKSKAKGVAVAGYPSLTELLFNDHLSKEDWKTSIKQHVGTITNTLLNGNYKAFDTYMEEAFGSLVVKKDATKKVAGKSKGSIALVDNSSLNQLNYKALLQELLQLAILIEHSTIPPYLTALYSIKDGSNVLPAQILRSVAVEEMLHMIMVCNVMNAVDIQPSVNRPQNFPDYPTKLPLNVDFYVGREMFSQNTVATFIAIESPSSPVVKAPTYETSRKGVAEKGLVMAEPGDNWSLPVLQKFIQENIDTIGEFYDFVFFFIVIFQALAIYKETGKFPTSFEELNNGGIFKGNPKKQIRPEQYYGSGGILHAVENLHGVMEVFEEIKGQGEGADGSIFDTDPSQFEEGFEPAHYFRFKEIFHEHFYAPGDYKPFMDDKGMMPITTPPVGKSLPVDWNAVYPIRPNLKMADLTSNPALYQQAKEFNVTYKRLLDAVQAAVEGRQEELEKSILIMYALKEQAIALMKQPFSAQENAAPTFEYPSN